MTYQVKEGDVLEYRGDGEFKSAFYFKMWEKYKVEKNGSFLFIRSECGGEARAVLPVFPHFGFHLVTTPPATIQHEGYNYTRGEPVVPAWVKDEAWIVDKEDGAISQLFICGNSAGVHGYTETDYGSIDLCDVADVFRPFTNEDWKWGMWAEYQGEKVFVTKVYTVGAVISTPKEEHLVVLFSEITPTTAP